MAEQITRADDERRDRDSRGGTLRQEAVWMMMVGRGGKLPRRHKKPPIWRCGRQCATHRDLYGSLHIDQGLYVAYIEKLHIRI